MTVESIAEKANAASASAASAPAISPLKENNNALSSTSHTVKGESSDRANATFVTLARNSDLWEIVKSIRQVEDRFNRNYHYDWVFLNDKPFDSTFKAVTSSLISGKTHYGEISKEHWSFPEHIDQDKARKVREDMAQRKIIYGDSVSYRHMCRFESGFFFQHPLMKQFEWYWRVEPSIELYCDIGYDTFKYMRDHGKKYSFVLSLYEYVETIPTLWDSVKTFMKEHPEHIAEGNSMEWLSDDKGETYNHCHFVSSLRSTCLSSDAKLCFSGPTSKSATSTGSGHKLTPITLTDSIKTAGSFTNGGEMPRCTRSPLLSFSRRKRSTSSTTSLTTTCPLHIARLANNSNSTISVLAIPRTTSTGRDTHVSHQPVSPSFKY